MILFFKSKKVKQGEVSGKYANVLSFISISFFTNFIQACRLSENTFDCFHIKPKANQNSLFVLEKLKKYILCCIKSIDFDDCPNYVKRTNRGIEMSRLCLESVIFSLYETLIDFPTSFCTNLSHIKCLYNLIC